ncbi:uncharacterized protein TOT_020001050 [Theileria orientalis strain Shintoku]|uniref:Ribosome biogenesis protein NOP53 n=1 Tax=Theileria orientalis strain Shintoku TaxID=869250 RepID=J4C399_THEOR|nr:uncharacterized protein TOT_020001050 [Theileria orientalis strain Shintoku]BAM40071.1 uncharacterized protein TOT_020001050 [Theileria orientalis strain Shintoku]|eukprot:XP_009690372.1 uncharacterized protein TOT_020001050 [Theileria orientalis strain Shintoku]
MSKKSKRIKKRINSSIDDKYIDSYVNKDKQLKPESLFKYDIIGKLSLKEPKSIETRKSKHFKIKNSPEVAKLKKLKRKLLLSDKMLIDADSTADAINIDADVDDIWNDAIYEDGGKKINKIKNINQLIPAVEMPHPGQSYNPKPDDYVSLINHSVNIINLSKKDEIADGKLLNTHKNIFERASALKSENVDDDQVKELESTNDTDELEDEVMEGKKVQKRKSRTERNKLKALKEENRKKMVIKSIKKLKNDVDHIKKLNTAIKKLDSSSKHGDDVKKFKRYLNRLISGEIPTKIGNKKFYKDPPEVILNEEIISEKKDEKEESADDKAPKNISIKNIQNVDENPVKNVYKSIYRRGLLPPPPTLNSRYKNLVKRLYNRRYIYKSVLSSS